MTPVERVCEDSLVPGVGARHSSPCRGVAVAAPALQPGDPATDVGVLAEWLDVPVGTLKRWAQKDSWPRRHTTTHRGRRTEYSMKAARASYDNRRGAGQSRDQVN